MALEDLTVAELKEKLRKKGLPVSGTKSELVKRLRKKDTVPANVVNKELYRRVREHVKERVKSWPSAYASGQVVQEYKRAGGKYKGRKTEEGLDRWYREKWVNVCKKSGSGSGSAECGRKESKPSKYPYCRPSKRISKATPMTVSELKKKYGNEKLEKMCRKKRSKGLPVKGKARNIRRD